VISYLVGLALFLTGLYIFQYFAPNLFVLSFGPKAVPSNILDLETVMIWRERGFDTLIQVLALSASLLGVLLFMVRGGVRHD